MVYLALILDCWIKALELVPHSIKLNIQAIIKEQIKLNINLIKNNSNHNSFFS